MDKIFKCLKNKQRVLSYRVLGLNTDIHLYSNKIQNNIFSSKTA